MNQSDNKGSSISTSTIINTPENSYANRQATPSPDHYHRSREMSVMSPADYHKRFAGSQRQNAPSPLHLAITPTTNRYPSVGYDDDRALSPCASSVGENTYFLDSGTGRPVRNVTSVHIDGLMRQRSGRSYYVSVPSLKRML